MFELLIELWLYEKPGVPEPVLWKCKGVCEEDVGELVLFPTEDACLRVAAGGELFWADQVFLASERRRLNPNANHSLREVKNYRITCRLSSRG